MKNRRILLRTMALIAVVAVVMTCCAVVFAACNKNKTKSISDIFKSRSSYGEFTSYKTEFTLPAGWEVYTSSGSSSSGSSDVGYIEALDAFVVCLKDGDSTKLSIYKCNDNTDYKNGMPKGMMFSPNQGIRALRVKAGLIVCLFDDGTLGAFDAKSGREVLSRKKLGYDSAHEGEAGYLNSNNTNIDDSIKALSSDMIAVHYNYDHAGKSGFTSIYRPTYDGSVDDRGELVCRVKNEGNLMSYVSGYDGNYVVVAGNSSGDYIYKIPRHAASGGAEDLSPTSRGTVSSNGNTGYYKEITYIGQGRFFIHEDWELGTSLDEGEEYTYYDGEKYYKAECNIYTPDNDSRSAYNSNKLFAQMTNNYYDSSKIGIDTTTYINDGYTYVGYGLSIIEEADGIKYGYYDQFIVDSKLNIVMSLTGNYGVTLKDPNRNEVSFFDLMMCGVDGYYYVPLKPSQIKLYDGSGKLVGSNARSNATRQELNSNIMVVETPDPNSSSSSLYGAYDRYGNELVKFEYNQLAAFRGPYTIGRRYGKEENGETQNKQYLCLIGPNGEEITQSECIDKDGNVKTQRPFEDIAHTTVSSTSASTAIYKSGCYMFCVSTGTTSGSSTVYKYGVRNFNPSIQNSVIIPAQMESGSILYSPSSSPSNVFVFEKITSNSTVTYVVHRLI